MSEIEPNTEAASLTDADWPLRGEAAMYRAEHEDRARNVHRSDPASSASGSSSARARLESVTRVRGLVETAHNYLARTPAPPKAHPELPSFHVDNVIDSEIGFGMKEQALDAFDLLERILVQWQGFEQDKLA